ncbi:hypothetical protein C8Q80DRAFT_365081 [Daedaleopsis nitida]|nr:hypothetical protein C8Q80DRAFT_365081 [Daedaleopsis nitida]
MNEVEQLRKLEPAAKTVPSNKSPFFSITSSALLKVLGSSLQPAGFPRSPFIDCKPTGSSESFRQLQPSPETLSKCLVVMEAVRAVGRYLWTDAFGVVNVLTLSAYPQSLRTGRSVTPRGLSRPCTTPSAVHARSSRGLPGVSKAVASSRGRAAHEGNLRPHRRVCRVRAHAECHLGEEDEPGVFEKEIDERCIGSLGQCSTDGDAGCLCKHARFSRVRAF